MNQALLDVNVLLALFDPNHVFHAAASRWFRINSSDGWATCPITQNGFIRIVTNPSYPQAVTVAQALDRLRTAAASGHHAFWPDDVTLLDADRFETDHVLTSGQITDTYLLGLAVRMRGRLVTFDRRIDETAVRSARPDDLLVLDPRAG